MNGQPTNKKRLLATLEYLYKYSDTYHTVTSVDIMEHIQKKYGIEADRRSVYRDIAALNDFGIDIVKMPSKKEGYYMASKIFEPHEIKLLLDAVLSAPFITEKKTEQLRSKLLSMLSTFKADEIDKQTFLEKRVKLKNEQIYYSIDCINNAITQKKKVKFKYHHYKLKGNKITADKGKEFLLSPYALLWCDDKYYLVGNYEKYDDVSHYRIDRMSNVRLLDKDIRPYSEVCEYTDCFDTADYARKSFKMYAGKPQRIVLLCDNGLFETMLDKFGFDANYKQISSTDFTVTATANISNGLLDWLISYCDKCRIIAPTELNIMLRNKIDAIKSYINNI